MNTTSRNVRHITVVSRAAAPAAVQVQSRFETGAMCDICTVCGIIKGRYAVCELL